MLLPVAEIVDKLIDGLIGLGMANHLRKELGRHGYDVGAGEQGIVYVVDMANAADDNRRRDATLAEYLMRALDDGESIVADVADASVEQAYEIGACARRHHRLVERHAAGAIDPHPLLLEFADHGEFVPPDRHLDIESGVIAELLAKFERLANHFARFEREDLNAQRDPVFVALKQFYDSSDVQGEVSALLFRHDRRVSGHTGGKAPLERILNFVQVGTIYENFHEQAPPILEWKTICSPDGLPFHFVGAQGRMRDDQMPNHSLKRLGVRCHSRAVHCRNDDAGNGDLRGVAPVAPHDPQDLGMDSACEPNSF